MGESISDAIDHIFGATYKKGTPLPYCMKKSDIRKKSESKPAHTGDRNSALACKQEIKCEILFEDGEISSLILQVIC